MAVPIYMPKALSFKAGRECLKGPRPGTINDMYTYKLQQETRCFTRAVARSPIPRLCWNGDLIAARHQVAL